MEVIVSQEQKEYSTLSAKPICDKFPFAMVLLTQNLYRTVSGEPMRDVLQRISQLTRECTLNLF